MNSQTPLKRGFTDVFRSELLFVPGRSEKWLPDFVERCSTFWARRCVGTVYLLSSWPDGPNCGIFLDTILPALKDNKNVVEIILVNAETFQEQRVFWRSEDPVDNGQPRDIDTFQETIKDGLGVATVLAIAGGAAVGGPALIGQLAPLLTSSNDKNKPPEKFTQLLPDSITHTFTPSLTADDGSNPAQVFSLNAPVDGTMDVFSTTTIPGFDSTIFTPDTLHLPATDQTQLFSATPDTDMFAAGSDGQSGAGADTLDTIAGTGTEIWATDPKDSSDNFFATRAERHITLQPRACDFASAHEQDLAPWYDKSHGIAGGGSGLQVSYPGASPWVATVRVTQRRLEALVPFSYQLSIQITDSRGQDMGGVDEVTVTPYQELQVPRTILSSSLYVWTQLGDDSPIMFRYGTNGVEWDSSDSGDHNCKPDPWKGDEREIDCQFNY